MDQMTPEKLRDLHELACPLSDLPYDWTDHSSLPGCTCVFGAERRAAALTWDVDRVRIGALKKQVELLEKERDAIMEELPDSLLLRTRIAARLATLAAEED